MSLYLREVLAENLCKRKYVSFNIYSRGEIVLHVQLGRSSFFRWIAADDDIIVDSVHDIMHEYYPWVRVNLGFSDKAQEKYELGRTGSDQGIESRERAAEVSVTEGAQSSEDNRERS